VIDLGLPSDVDRFANFCAERIPHVKGPLASRREYLHLDDWQMDDWGLALSLDEHGNRVFHDLVYVIPKKNGKSLIACAAGFFMLGPTDAEMGAEGYAAAGDREQAKVVHNVAKLMVDPLSTVHSPQLAAEWRKRRDVLLGPDNATWAVVPHNADGVEGCFPHFISCDEYAVHKSPQLRNNLRSGRMGREQPFCLTISTAGNDKTRPLYALEQNLLKLPNVEKVTPYKTVAWSMETRTLYIRYGLDEDDTRSDLEDPDVIRGCNPSPNVTLATIQSRLADPTQDEDDVRIKNFNQWRQVAGARAIPMQWWDECSVKDLVVPDGAPVMIGIDVGLTDDTTAVTWASRMPDDTIHTGARIFTPPEGDGEELDLEDVQLFVDELLERYQVRGIVIDPAYMTDTRQAWVKRGLPVVDAKQYPSLQSMQSMSLFATLKTRQLRVPTDPELRAHADNARKKPTDRGFRFVRPGEDRARKIDGIISLSMCVHALLATGGGVSVYEERGFLEL
jgi:phage terminase large subunit-like protein